ncbi:hypothetical protein HAX54_016924, partial [Datura stramonium]|nr:hypothetical protein [Datura stramonium]
QHGSSSAAQGLQDKPCSMVRSSWRQSNSEGQFYVGSPSSDDKTPIVSARLKIPRMVRAQLLPPKRNKRGRDGDTRHGVVLDINGDGYKMAYEAVDRKLKPGKRDKMMQNIIDASPSKVKALRIKYCSPPSPPDLDGRHKKMRRGESSSSSTLETQHYSGGPSNMVSVQGKTQDILMSAETTTEQVQEQQVISVEKIRAEQEVPHNYVVPPVSASHMEEDPSSMELLVSEGKGTAEETAHGAVSASQMEGNECPADDLMVGFRVDDQLVFYDAKGREIDASGHDHDISNSVELNAPTVVVESIDPEQHVQPSELDSGIARNME